MCVLPRAKLEADLMQVAHVPETEFFVQPNATRIFATNARDERVQLLRARVGNQVLVHGGSNPLLLRRGCNVNGCLGSGVVSLFWPG